MEGFELGFFSKCDLVLKFCTNDVSREKGRRVSQVLVSKQCVHIWIYLFTNRIHQYSQYAYLLPYTSYNVT